MRQIQREADCALLEFRRALSIFQELLEENHIETAIVFMQIGDLLHSLGKHSDALLAFMRAFAICIKCMDEDNLSFPAMELISAGRLLNSKG
jgi:tetratricopeptide (TPR) repeat protein